MRKGIQLVFSPEKEIQSEIICIIFFIHKMSSLSLGLFSMVFLFKVQEFLFNFIFQNLGIKSVCEDDITFDAVRVVVIPIYFGPKYLH